MKCDICFGSIYFWTRCVYITCICMYDARATQEGNDKAKNKNNHKKRHRVYTDTQHQANAKVKERILVIGTK